METYQIEFLNAIKQGAIDAWKTSKILPSITAAQAIVESGWGTSRLAKPPNNNLFGVKAAGSWTGPKVAMRTQEDGSGGLYWITAYFCVYDSWAASVVDRGRFFTGTEAARNRYKNVIGEMDYKKAAYAMSAAGYATDRTYAPKLINTIESNGLAKWDQEIDRTSAGTVEVVSGKIDLLIKWFEDRIGRSSYSMGARLGPYSFDCSSSVHFALIYAGFLPKGSFIGTTESLFAQSGKLLIPINASERQRGDIFVSGIPGQSMYAAGHTGVCYGNGKIIHCTVGGGVNGIAITSDSWTGHPNHWYRLRGSREQRVDNGSTNSEASKENKISYININSVNNNLNWIENKALVNEYGIIYTCKKYDVANASELLAVAKADLDNQVIDNAEINVNALNLAYLGQNYDDYKLGNYYLVDNPLVGENRYSRVVKKDIDWLKPDSSKLVMNRRNSVLADFLVGRKAKQNDYELNELKSAVTNLENVVSNISNNVLVTTN